MLSSRVTRLLLIMVCLSVVASCATIGDKSEAQIVDSTRVENEKLTPVDKASDKVTDVTINAQNILVDEGVEDPMEAVVLPLTLIQGYDNVSTLVLKKQQQQAVNMLIQLQQNHPSFSGPSYRLARVYQQMKNDDDGLIAINKAIEINPRNYFALNLKGLMLREKGDFDNAKLSYLEAIKIYPNHSNSELNLAILADIYLYDFDLALVHYERYLQLIKHQGAEEKQQKKVAGWITDLKRRMPKGA